MSKYSPQNFNDFLALLMMVVVFPALWILQGKGVLNIPEGVIGATIAIETMIAQYYFRKSKTEV
jgi:hypothetical protein